jgi:hypothetical protein
MFPVHDFTDVDVAFPARVVQFMPAYKDIPDEFRTGNHKYAQFFHDSFYFGLSKLEMKPRPGVDPEKAFKHIRCVMGSFEPAHEHKEASVAFLVNEWFEDVVWERRPRA